MKNLKKALYPLSISERKNLILLLTMLMMTAILDMIGVVSILPFIGALTNPELLKINTPLKFLYKSS